jgi:L-ascorbate metabolism protein UlaG (beta-lactamase superfamily)
MKQTWHGRSAFRGEAAAEILIVPFLLDNPSRKNRRSRYLTGKNSTQGGHR